MATRSVCCLVVALVAQAQLPRAPLVTPTAGMVITTSVRLAPGVYKFAGKDDTPAITIKGEKIDVDFAGVTILGGDPLGSPDVYVGTGVFVDGGRDVTIRGASVRGYKVGILARGSPALHITTSDLSYNWKPRLWSGIEKESLVDWMSYHQNDKDEWLRYGAGIYLVECDDAQVDNSRAVQGQNGLMVTRSARVKIWNNTFSWLSGIGLGLYRVTDSTIQANKLDWDVRGYSHGFYNRGQDSAALLMYEQSSQNVVAYNSATHGGDGLFLWAGQSTMDSGFGGANDNLFYDNDFSHAVANGIEATFSRNKFIANRVDDCWHGVWGGYSFESEFLFNAFRDNTEAIAIEHGQDNKILNNVFVNNETALRLWANTTQDPNWIYPQKRDTRSRDYTIADNSIDSSKVAVNVIRTSGVLLARNALVKVETPVQKGDGAQNVRVDPADAPTAVPGRPVGPAKLPGMKDAKLPDKVLRGRATIIVDEWGPYDYRSPKLWPAGKPTDRPLKLRVLGPKGRWTVSSLRGATVSPQSGLVPGEITVTPTSPRGGDFAVRLEYAGGEVVSSRGQVYAAGTRVPFSYSVFEPAIDWNVKYWTFDAESDPVAKPDAFAAKVTAPPTKTETLARLDVLTSRAISEGLPNDRVALRAEGTVTLPVGEFELDAISDDGIKIWVDGKLVLDKWSIHESEIDRVAIAGGRHQLRIDYFESTGWAELKVRLSRK